MTIFWRWLLLAIISLNYFSCALISPRLEKEINISSPVAIERCKPTPVFAAYTMDIKELTSQIREADPDAKEGWYSYYLRNYLRTSSLLDFAADDSNGNKIYVNFLYRHYVSSNLVERIWYTSMIVTLGIIPSYTHASEVLSAQIFDSKGNDLGTDQPGVFVPLCKFINCIPYLVGSLV